mgnify:CR=1 FL=1
MLGNGIGGDLFAIIWIEKEKKLERIKELNIEKSKKLSLDIDNIYKEMCDLVPAKRLGKPEEFGYLIAFLSSNKASYINGVNIPIDGSLLKSF